MSFPFVHKFPDGILVVTFNSAGGHVLTYTGTNGDRFETDRDGRVIPIGQKIDDNVFSAVPKVEIDGRTMTVIFNNRYASVRAVLIRGLNSIAMVEKHLKTEKTAALVVIDGQSGKNDEVKIPNAIWHKLPGGTLKISCTHRGLEFYFLCANLSDEYWECYDWKMFDRKTFAVAPLLECHGNEIRFVFKVSDNNTHYISLRTKEDALRTFGYSIGIRN